MRVAKQDIPVKIDVPGAVARQTEDFGDPAGLGPLAGEYLSLGAGTDIAPLLQGLEHDMCPAPHWGYVISGEAAISFADGAVETCRGGDLFYWPPGHSVARGRRRRVDLVQPAPRPPASHGPHDQPDG